MTLKRNKKSTKENWFNTHVEIMGVSKKREKILKEKIFKEVEKRLSKNTEKSL